MAGIRKLKGKWYIRVRYKGKEKLIPTYTSIRRDADIVLRKYQLNEQEVKYHLSNSLIEQNLTIDDCIKYFKKHYKLEKGVTEKTMKSYILSLGDLKTCFRHKKSFYDIQKADYPFLVEYLKRNVSDITANIRLRSIRAFLNYLHERGVINEVPFKIKEIKIDQQEPKLIKPDELLKIYREVDNHYLLSVYRVYEHSGMRLSELKNSYRDGEFIVIFKSKSRKKRIVPIPIEIIPDYDKALEVNYSTGHISKMFRRYTNVAGLPGKTIHCLRHTYAYRTLMETKNIQLVRDLLGHSSVKVTEIYTRMPEDYVKQLFDNGRYISNDINILGKA
jgi:site-specific recombinase XerD